MGNIVITELVDGECITSAALLDKEGFTIERTSSDLKPNLFSEIFDLQSEKMLTIVAENSTIVISRIHTGHSIMIQCPVGSNLGKARQKLIRACEAILPFL